MHDIATDYIHSMTEKIKNANKLFKYTHNKKCLTKKKKINKTNSNKTGNNKIMIIYDMDGNMFLSKDLDYCH